MLRLQKTFIKIEIGVVNLLTASWYEFSRKRKMRNEEQEFEKKQKEYAEDYFQAYRNEIDKQSVIKDFRRQIFDRNTEPTGKKQFEKALDSQQNRLNELLSQNSKEKVNKISNKIMQHHLNNKKMFKGLDNKEIFKDYADYTAYKSNHLKIQKRNYESMDTIEYSRNGQNTYAFLQNLPDEYEQKQEELDAMREAFPDQHGQMSLKQYGRVLQDKVNRFSRQKSHMAQYFSMKNQQEIQNTYSPLQKTSRMHQYGHKSFVQGSVFTTPVLSTEIINQIYTLYLQGWSIRQISKRFGILPARAKLHIWCRARLYNQLAPRYGLGIVLQAYARQQQVAVAFGTMDYGLDLAFMDTRTQLEGIYSWEQERLDAQRKPQEYTAALRKLEEKKKFGKYDQVEIGSYGKQNKKYLLKEWKFYRGDRSPETILKNKTFVDLMWHNRNYSKQYY